MRDLDFGSAFSRTIDLYGKHFVPLITYSAIFYGVVALLWALVFGLLITSVTTAAVVGLLGIGLTLIASVLLTGAYIVALDEAERTGTFPSFGVVWPQVTPHIGALFVTGLLSALGVMAGFLLLVIPGLVLATWWFVASPVVMLEGRSGTQALGRSRELVRGHGWTVFGLFVVVTILTAIVSSILGAITGAIFGFNDVVEVFMGEFVPGVLTGPIGALLAVVVYQSLRGDGAGGTDATGLDAPHSYQPPTTPPPASPTDQSGPFV